MKDQFYQKHILYSPEDILKYFNKIQPEDNDISQDSFKNYNIDISILPLKQQQIIKLYLMGKTFKEMGIILNISPQAAHKMFKRAIIAFKKHYKG